MTDKEFKNVARSLEQQFKQNPGMCKRGFEAFLTKNAYLSIKMTQTFVKRYLDEGQDENLKEALRREFSET